MRRVQRIFAVMAAAVVAALIVACDPDVTAPAGTGVSAAETETSEYETVPRLEDTWSGMRMITFDIRQRTLIDPETGVHYFVVYNLDDGGVGICVAVDADGRPLIKGGREKEE